FMTAPIDEVDAPRVAVGQPARVSLDAFGARRFPARVRRISPYVLDLEKQARTVEVEVEFTQPGDIRELLAGYSADVEIILEQRKQRLRIPSEALLDNAAVFLFIPQRGLIERRAIETGLSNWDHTEVLKGLTEGDLVITSVDRDGVENGAPARIEASDR
ncbi:MAG: efflux transporter periplasmic adaptor subunit, partial [Candidatus Sedimenticola endophacoides]